MRSRLPTTMTVLALVLAVIGVGGVVSGAADDKPAGKLASTSATTTTSAVANSLLPGATVTTIASGGPATSARATGTTAKPTATTAASAGCVVPAAATADPGTHQPPAIGTYTYASCTDGSQTSEMKVAAGTSGSGTTRRNVSEDAGGVPQTASLAYAGSGVLFESFTVQTPNGEFTCDWIPDLLNYPAALKVGTEWTTKSSCQLKDAKGVSFGELQADGTGGVTGRVLVDVGGTAVNAWVIEGLLKLTTKIAGGSGSTTITSKDYYDPKRGLDLYRHAETEGQEGEFIRDERLTSLSPRA